MSYDWLCLRRHVGKNSVSEKAASVDFKPLEFIAHCNSKYT